MDPMGMISMLSAWIFCSSQKWRTYLRPRELVCISGAIGIVTTAVNDLPFGFSAECGASYVNKNPIEIHGPVSRRNLNDKMMRWMNSSSLNLHDIHMKSTFEFDETTTWIVGVLPKHWFTVMKLNRVPFIKLNRSFLHLVPQHFGNPEWIDMHPYTPSIFFPTWRFGSDVFPFQLGDFQVPVVSFLEWQNYSYYTPEN